MTFLLGFVLGVLAAMFSPFVLRVVGFFVLYVALLTLAGIDNIYQWSKGRD